MKKTTLLAVAIAALMFWFSGVSEAVFIDRGSGMIYDTDQDITWLQDANYAHTSGVEPVHGAMNFNDARDWASNLVYGNYNDWRLPTTPGTQLGFVNEGEMGHLFYDYGISSSSPGPFTNLRADLYWTGTEYSPAPDHAWFFSPENGRQDFDTYEAANYAWAVRDGDVVHTHCVSTGAELQDALNVAATNNTPDIIRIRSSVDPYVGNPVYSSAEPYGLTIEGGYTDESCTVRVVDATNNVLDGDNTGRVLTLDCSGVAADLVVDGLTIRNGNVNIEGGGLYAVTKGTVTLTNNTISDNSASGGGGIYFYSPSGTLTMSNNNINNNYAPDYGGGVYIRSISGTGIFNLTDNNISYNSTENGAGGIYFYSPSGTLTMSNNNINNNYAPAGTGGVQINIFDSGTFNLTNNTISDNNASASGGIYFISDSGILTMSNNNINNNYSTGYGDSLGAGGVKILSEHGTVTLTNNNISYNSTQNGTGGIYFDNPLAGIFTLTKNTINNNSSQNGAGGVSVVDAFYSSFTLTNNIISYNSTQNSAGGIYFNSYHGIFTLTNNTIINNNANDGYGGGVWLWIYYDDAISNIYNNIVWNNSASQGLDLYISNDGDAIDPPSPVKLYNNDFTDAYIQDLSTVISENNITQPPEFDVDGYHLTASSPCIDAGATVSEPTYDIDGDSRPQGDGYDIGADEYVTSDSDGDGFPDDQDACPFSDLSGTVVIDGWDTGVENVLLEDGCTISDLISQCAEDADNHGEFVSSVSHTTNYLKKGGIIDGKEKGMIQKGAAKADLP